ncbi:MAG: SGNH/GDSL hydrolase family protein [Lacibacter sp.]
MRKPGTESRSVFKEHPDGIFIKQSNNLGFVKAADTRITKESGLLRVLVTGDSHTDGYVHTHENFCTLLEAQLQKAGKAVEVLNAGVAYYSFPNYPGALFRNLFLRPDVFVLVAYTGNDFIENCMYNFRWNNPVQSLRQFRARIGWRNQYPLMYNNQSLGQVLYFYLYPHERQRALNYATAAIDRMATKCTENKIRFILFLLPTDYDLQPAYRSQIKAAYGFPNEALDVNQWLARQLAAYASARGIEVVDPSLSWKPFADSLYYPKDHHINAAGNRAVATALLPLLMQSKPQ